MLGGTHGKDIHVNGDNLGSVSALHTIYDNGLTARLNG
jgi:hypothetical protein